MSNLLDVPWSIPNGWSWTTAGEVSDVVGGGTPRSDDSRNFDGGTIPWITPADLSGYRAKYISRGSRSLTERGLAESAARLLPMGTVLFSSRAPIGYVAIAANPVATNQGFKSFIPPPELDPEFLYYYLQRARSLAMDLASGTTFLEISGAKTERLPLIVAPLPEQHRIVEAIESYFTRLDDAVATLERVQRNLKRYRASVLKAAVEGRLVPTEAELARAEGRDYEPASVLLERILAERRRRWHESGARGKYQEPAAPDTCESRDLSDGWCWATLDQLLTSLEGGTAVTATSAGTSRRVLRSSAVRAGHIALEDCRFLPVDAPMKDDPFIHEGDLLFTRLSGTLEYVGNCAIVPPLGGRNLEFPDRLFRGRCATGVSRSYIQLCFGEAGLRHSLETAAKSTAGHQRISLSDLREFRLPLPPGAEQHRIAEVVSQHLSVIAATEAASKRDSARCSRLRQSILKWAFEGRLADQDPSDEPASVLLERIRSETSGSRQSASKRAHPAR